MAKYVCPNCGHDKIYLTIGDIVAQEVLKWTYDGKEPRKLGYREIVYVDLPKYICPHCFVFFNKPERKENG